MLPESDCRAEEHSVSGRSRMTGRGLCSCSSQPATAGGNQAPIVLLAYCLIERESDDDPLYAHEAGRQGSAGPVAGCPLLDDSNNTTIQCIGGSGASLPLCAETTTSFTELFTLIAMKTIFNSGSIIWHFIYCLQRVTAKIGPPSGATKLV
jgi:hypothetical protein